ncbi:MAG: class I SAM-dependent methyltransferase [Gammaproteobacteria bacterium]|nr:class I SAM-dependent methyltransferase [Gammaproteobacteria bacterium]
MKKTDFDEHATDYNTTLKNQLQFFEEDNGYFAEYKVKKAKQLVVHEPTNILDFGCGIGRSIPFFQKHFPAATLYGCDLSEKSLETATAQYKTAMFLSVSELDRTDIQFNLIFLAGVLHHITPDERQATMAFLKKHLTADGNLVIFEHNPYNPLTRYLVNTCPFDEDAILLKPGEIKHQMREAGIKPIACHYTLFFPQILYWLRPLENSLRFFPLGGQYVVQGSLK